MVHKVCRRQVVGAIVSESSRTRHHRMLYHLFGPGLLATLGRATF